MRNQKCKYLSLNRDAVLSQRRCCVSKIDRFSRMLKEKDILPRYEGDVKMRINENIDKHENNS